MEDPKSHFCVDSDDDSDTLATDSVHLMDKTLLEEHIEGAEYGRRAHAHRRCPSLLTWLRWGIVVVLQTIVIVQLALRSRQTTHHLVDTEPGGDINGLYSAGNSTYSCILRRHPLLTMTDIADHEYRRLKFEEDLYMPNMTSFHNRDEVRRRWDELLPRKTLLTHNNERR
jgi:hypothetical protein